MKKVAIITWCNVNINYGQVLQAYALQRALHKLGYEAVTINYDNSINIKLNNPFIRKIYQYYIQTKNTSKILRKTKIKFNLFVRKYVKMSNPCFSKDEIENEVNKQGCSILICGSDQIWNPNNFDPVYYLDFCNNSMLRIAYAPSIANDINDKNKLVFNKMKNLIEKIDFVSVREERAVQTLSQLMNKEIACLLDPTFLISSRSWDRITTKSKMKEEYAFCYILGDIKQHRENISRILRKYNIDKAIYVRTNDKIKDTKEEFLNNIGPDDFITLVKNSVVVYTDSFHGVALSINYNKEFYASNRYNPNYRNKLITYCDNSRILNILDIFKLNNRYIDSDIMMIDDEYIDYKEVNLILKDERKRAYKFLHNSLNNLE